MNSGNLTVPALILAALCLGAAAAMWLFFRRSRQDLKRKNAQLSGLAALDADFSLIAEADLAHDRIHVLRVSDRMALSSFDSGEGSFSFTAAVQELARSQVAETDRARFLEALTPVRILEALSSRYAYYVNFRVIRGEQDLFMRCKITLLPGMKDTVMIGITNVDEMLQNEARLYRRLEETIGEQTAELRRRNSELRDMSEDVIELLGNIVEARDMESGEHIRRVKGITLLLAEQMMKDYPEYGLTPHAISSIVAASALHDLGKIMIPDSILLKPGTLTKAEFEVMKTHSALGAEILEHAPRSWDPEYLNYSKQIARWHHEKYDGKGYPDGLKGDEIPIAAQIVSVADCYDALNSSRRYKPAYPPEIAYDMIVRGECGAFSDKMLAVLARCRQSLIDFARDPDASRNLRLADVDKALSGMTVLVVDDSSLSRTLTSEMLEDEGASILQAEGGEDAVRVFSESAPGAITVVLMDLSMPGMDGFEAAREIRKLDRADASVPIIALTATTNRENREMCLKAGMNDCLSKPIVISRMVNALLRSVRSGPLSEEPESPALSPSRDPLTGVYSLSAYMDRIQDLSARMAADRNLKLAMILCDINSLKTVNDTLGHDAGDQYIRNCASLICRASEGVPVYRVGGDEFLLILADEDHAKVPAVMRNLCDLLARAGSEKTIESGLCSFAYGLGEYNPETDQTLSDIFRRADETMYKHKVKAWIQR